MNGISSQLLAPVEALQFDQKLKPDNLAAQLPDERNGRGCSSTGCEQVVDNEHSFSYPDGVAVNSQRVRPVFQAIFHFKTIGW